MHFLVRSKPQSFADSYLAPTLKSNAGRHVGRVTPVALFLASGLFFGCDDKNPSNVDETPPTLDVTSPEVNDTVSGVGFYVAVSADDDESGMARVEVLAGSSGTFTDSSAPFDIFVPTVAESTGVAFDLEVRAYDVAGNVATATVPVTRADRTITPITSNTNSDTEPSWSRSGQRLAFQSNRFGQWDIFLIDADGTDEVRLTSDTNDDQHPTWGTTGQSVLFDSERAGGGVEADLWSILLVSGEASATPLTFGSSDDRSPSVSADGANVVFSSNRGLGNQYDLWSIPSAGGTAASLTGFLEDDVDPAHSPVDNRIAFASNLNFDSPHIYIRRPDASVFPMTGDTGVSEGNPAWSPQGAALLYERKSGAHTTLWIIVGEEGTPQQISFGTGVVGDLAPAWSPDGSTIAFASDRGGNLDLYLLK